MDRNEFQNSISILNRDPIHMQRMMIEQIEKAYGKEGGVFDTTTPLTHLVQMTAEITASFCDSTKTIARRQYPSLAVTPDDLAHHMADEDYVGRFAIPSTAPITIMMRMDEIMTKMVDTGNNTSKLVIPAGSTVTVTDTDVFTFTHPVEIRKLTHGGLTCLYDNSDPSPFHDLTTNQVRWDITPLHGDTHDERQGIDYLLLRVDLLQYKTKSKLVPVSAAMSFQETIAFEDQYFHTRVWNSVGGKWVEMATTHSDYVYDPLRPTAVLSVANGKVKVTIPPIYLTNQAVQEEVLIEIYTTKGDHTVVMSGMDSSEFILELARTRDPDQSKYVAPLQAVQERFVFSEGYTQGGRNAMTFLELRERVMNNSMGPQSIPITTMQAQAKLSRMGYDIVTRTDVVTRRVFAASRPLPKPTIGLRAPMNIAVPRWTIQLSTLENEPSVYYNGDRATITPKTLFKYQNGRVSLVTQSTIDAITSLPTDSLIEHLDNNQYMYTPYYYVLDQSGDVFRNRVYDFGEPKFDSVVFRSENDTLAIWASVQGRRVERTDNGWRVAITTKSGNGFKEMADVDIVGQLAFRPRSEGQRVYVNHTEIIRDKNNEIIFIFDLVTNYDVTEDNLVVLSNFRMGSEDHRDQLVELDQSYDFFIAITNPRLPNQKSSSIDQLIGRGILDGDWMGYYHESFVIEIGTPLTSIWSRSRPVVSQQEYRRYDRDVYLVYEKDEYERDANGELVYSIDNGKPKLRLIHAKGDQVLDGNGNPIVLHERGSLMLADGAPILVEDRNLLQEIDLTLFDGLYWFATAQSDIDYRNNVADTMVRWIVDDLNPIKKVLLDATDIYFRPKETMGNVAVIIGENDRTTMEATRSIFVTYYISKTVYRDSRLREAIVDMTSQVLSEALTKPVVTISGIVSDLHTTIGSDVIEVKVEGFEGQSVITMLDDSSRLSVGKRAIALPDGSITIQEDITVNFVLHRD